MLLDVRIFVQVPPPGAPTFAAYFTPQHLLSLLVASPTTLATAAAVASAEAYMLAYLEASQRAV